MRPSPLLVLQARAWARARLFEAGVYRDLGEALEPLYAYAWRMRLMERVGADQVIELIEGPFREIRLW